MLRYLDAGSCATFGDRLGELLEILLAPERTVTVNVRFKRPSHSHIVIEQLLAFTKPLLWGLPVPVQPLRFDNVFQVDHFLSVLPTTM